jgi:GLTT repeat (6 copies)
MIKSFSALSLVLVAGLCVSSAASALETQNGVLTNGVLTNGVLTNGVLTNGVITNGVITNGVITNGTAPNGLSANVSEAAPETDAAHATAVILKDGARVTLK